MVMMMVPINSCNMVARTLSIMHLAPPSVVTVINVFVLVTTGSVAVTSFGLQLRIPDSLVPYSVLLVTGGQLLVRQVSLDTHVILLN